MRVEVRESAIEDAGSDIVVAGLFDGGDLPRSLSGARGAEDAKSGYRKLTLLHPEQPPRALVAGLGKREEMEPERARVAAALAAAQAAGIGARSVAWELPDSDDPPAIAAALVTGTVLAGYRFDRYRSSEEDEEKPGEIEELIVLGPAELSAEVEIARVCAEAQNRARELQDLPSNVATPSYLYRRAEEIDAEHGSISTEVLGREEIAERGMGGIEAVSAGSAEDPALIVLRYDGGGSGPPLGLVGKGVTFDTGGISLKPGTSMHEMKMDMSGAAAVLEAVAAIAELGLAIDLIAVIPSTENMPSGTAVKPGDIITQYNGKTVEVNNTDAEGRLILADALAYCVELGAGCIIDIATLTGAVLVALGSTYSALISNDEELASAVERAAEETGELAWRLPLHPEYKELTKGTVADLTNLAAKRKAGTIYAGSFLEEFVDGRPWAHLDIAGTAWDVGRPYVGTGPTGFGVRLFVALAREMAGS
ncbi:MAG: leucyl aminopeptidase [Solirubrobacterales bacterium]